MANVVTCGVREIPQTKLFRPISFLRKGDSLELLEQRLRCVSCIGDDRNVGKGEEVALLKVPGGMVELLRGNQCVPNGCILLDPSRAIFFDLLGLPDRKAK